MKWIVPPQADEHQDRICPLVHTMCALCSEDPRFCPGPGPIEKGLRTHLRRGVDPDGRWPGSARAGSTPRSRLGPPRGGVLNATSRTGR